MNVIFVAGTAGSGKSLLTSALRDWYVRKSANAITVNLDPGVLNLPYVPDVDIRDMIDFEEVMQTYKLGPNGALILAADLIATRLSEIQDQIESTGADHVIVDTAGQTELFAFRESGSYIVRELSADSKILLFLMDPLLANTPNNFLSLTLLSASVALRLNVPRISVLTKKDLSPERAEKIVQWSKNAATFEADLATSEDGDQYALYSELFKTLRKTSFGVDLYPVSSVSQEGFVALVGEISRLTQGGEEITD
jgi:GTPase SAR1 family protein